MYEIELNEIIADMQRENENNYYYFNTDKEVGYRIHIFANGSVRCYKRTKKHEVTITDAEFIDGVKASFGNSIGEDSYENIGPQPA